MKIIGNTVGTTMPRTNYNQTDPKKADYLVGRENIVGKVTENSLGASSIALSNGAFAGCLGYYYSGIDLTNKYIYLTTKQVTPSIVTDNSLYNALLVVPYEVGDEFSLVNGGHYDLSGKITAISGNRITYSSDLPFTDINPDSGDDAYSFFVPFKPTLGIVPLGEGALAIGEEAFAPGKYAFALGSGVYSVGDFSTTIGANLLAVYGAVALNVNNEARQKYSLAGGYGSKTYALQSMAFGLGVINTTENSLQIGKYNDYSKPYLFSVGNGKSYDNRSNAFSVDGTGNVKANGKLTAASIAIAGDTNTGYLNVQGTAKIDGNLSAGSLSGYMSQLTAGKAVLGTGCSAGGSYGLVGGNGSVNHTNAGIVYGLNLKNTGTIGCAIFGRNNDSTENSVFQVGIGADANNRKNGMALDLSGNLKVSGTITDGNGNVLGGGSTIEHTTEPMYDRQTEEEIGVWHIYHDTTLDTYDIYGYLTEARTKEPAEGTMANVYAFSVPIIPPNGLPKDEYGYLTRKNHITVNPMFVGNNMPSYTPLPAYVTPYPQYQVLTILPYIYSDQTIVENGVAVGTVDITATIHWHIEAE